MKNETVETKKGNKVQRVVALAGVIILGLLIIATVVVSIMNKPELKTLFNLLFVLDIVVPVMLWMYIYLYNRARKTDAMMEEIADKELKEEEILRSLRAKKEEAEPKEDQSSEATEGIADENEQMDDAQKDTTEADA
ncbi:MAG: hypothetical protein MJ105_09720 [Lachnospiraceae bacterium]|nr:hypothetical protein [Lachnospiraceae bacterium]